MALQDIDIEALLRNIEESVPYILQIVTGVAYILGLFFAIRCFMLLKQGADERKMKLRAPLLNMLTAVVLLYLPSFLDASMQTVFQTTDIAVAPYISTTSETAKTLLVIAGRIVQLVGYIAFIRGWVLLVRVGEQGAQPGILGKATTHIVGGLLAINIFGTWNLIRGIIGV